MSLRATAPLLLCEPHGQTWRELLRAGRASGRQLLDDDRGCEVSDQAGFGQRGVSLDRRVLLQPWLPAFRVLRRRSVSVVADA